LRRVSGASFHVMILFERPGGSAVMGFLALPVEGHRLYFAERPPYRQAIEVCPPEHDAVAPTSPLRRHDAVELWIEQDNSSLFGAGIEESERGADRALLLVARRISNPEILDRMAIHDPAKPNFPLLMGNGSIRTRK